jgi:hypothetical protein
MCFDGHHFAGYFQHAFGQKHFAGGLGVAMVVKRYRYELGAAACSGT